MGFPPVEGTYLAEWLAAGLLILFAFAMALFDLPGNTVMVLSGLGFAFYDPAKYFDIRLISAMILVYAMGEIWEFALSFLGLRKKLRIFPGGLSYLLAAVPLSAPYWEPSVSLWPAVCLAALQGLLWQRICTNICSPAVCRVRGLWPGRRQKCSSWLCWANWWLRLSWRFCWPNRFSFITKLAQGELKKEIAAA